MSKEARFEKLYLAHRSKVMRLVLGYVKGNRSQADDLVQDIFIKVWEHLESFRGDAQIGTWIYRIAVNSCLMFLRSKKSLPLHTDKLKDTGEHPDGHEDRFKAMYNCIARLDEKDRSIILLELQDVSQQEIAEIMGMRHEAIRTRIHRIKDKLSKCVKND